MAFTSLNRPESNLSDGDKYPALRIVLVIWKVLVVVQVLGVVAFTIWSWATIKGPNPNAKAIGLLLMLGSFLIALVQWALAEIVQVVMDIEENTRRIADRA